uniref:Uncharacterized protein n=1 Tax=Sipha flava TaxID=143950 RepID=A0A2S2QFP0_9HEMI
MLFPNPNCRLQIVILWYQYLTANINCKAVVLKLFLSAEPLCFQKNLQSPENQEFIFKTTIIINISCREKHTVQNFIFFKVRILSFAMKNLIILSCIDKFTSFNFVKMPAKL